MYVKITSKLSHSQRQRINRAADRFISFDSGSCANEYAFGRDSKRANRYFPIIKGVRCHNIARNMMIVAGATFDYEVVH